MPYDPKTDRFPYPEQTDTHYLPLKKNNGLVFDENYPYVDKSAGFRFKQGLFRILTAAIGFPVCAIRINLRVKGKKNLRKYKDVLKKGVVSVANHVHMWDYLAIMSAVFPFKTNILVWNQNIRGENGTLIRLEGGIPVPTDNIRGMNASIEASKQVLMDGGWLHIYAEGSMWEWYQPIRPFKTGAAHYALTCDKPILPMAFSYRENGFFRKLFKCGPSYTLNIGEPIFPDKSKPLAAARDELTIKCHRAVCELAGIDPDSNLYPPLFKNNHRIDYYTDKYGEGYKGSW